MISAETHQMIEAASEAIEVSFARNSYIGPMWHAITSKGEHILMEAPHKDKDLSAAMMRALFEIKDVVCCLFIDEAWTVRSKDWPKVEAWLAEHGSLRNYPGRIEAVMFMAEDANGQVTALREIHRSPHGKPRLGPLQINDMTGWSSSGRLVGMLPKRGAIMQ